MIYERGWFKFDQENFILDYFSVDWEDLLKIDELNANNSTKMYLDKINMLLDTYAPLKRINKYFSDYLSNETSSTIFLKPTDKEEIANIISSLNSNKASGHNSIPYRILFLLKHEILKQSADLFNLSFTTAFFPSVLNTLKVVLVFKKD